MTYKYHKSDFSLLIELNAKRVNTFGEEIVVNTGYPFELKFFSSKQSSASAKFNVDNMDTYVASYDGTSVKNCKVLDDKHVLVYFDHTEFEFSPGMLYVETHSKVPDTRFEGDEVQNIKRLYTTGIELTDIADLDNDDTSELKIDLLQVYFTGTNIAIEQAEKARVQAENARVSAETTRQSQESARQTNTATAITNANAATATALKSAKCQPKIVGGTWWVYDVEQDKFVDTGFAANTDYQLTEAKMLAALPSISAVSITDTTEYPDLF